MALAALAVGSVLGGAAGLWSASTQAGVAGQQESMAATQFGEQQGFEQQLAALIANPSSITSNPAYQFTYNQGLDALTRQMAAKGYLGSGNMGVALEQYGQGLATSQLAQQEQLLAGLSGIQASSSPAQALSGASASQNASFNQLGQSLASIGYGATNLMGGMGDLGGAAGGWSGSLTPGSVAGTADLGSSGYIVNLPGG